MATAAVFIQKGTSVHLSNLTVRDVGGTGIKALSSVGLEIRRVAVLDAGSHGVSVTDSAGALVNNSFVRGYGLRFPAASGLTVTNSQNGTVSHCEVSGGIRSGISGGGTSDKGAFTTFAYNHVHGIGRESDDGLCDFGGYHGSSPGSKLPLYMTHNIFHNITAYANGGSGMYFDVSSSAWQVTSNLVYDVTNSALLWNVNPGVPLTEDAEPMRFINNVLIADRDNEYYKAIGNCSNGVPKGTPWGLGNEAIDWSGYTPAEFKRNVVVVDTTQAPSRGAWVGGKPCAKDVTKSSSCTWDYGGNFKPGTSSNNIWFNRTSGAMSTPTYPGGCKFTGDSCGIARGCSCRTWEQWTAAGEDSKSIRIDPQLKGDLHLVSAPAALKLGIEPLSDLARAGPDWELDASLVTASIHPSKDAYHREAATAVLI